MKKITIKTKAGQIKELFITANHKMFDVDGNEIKAGDLKIGDKLNIIQGGI